MRNVQYWVIAGQAVGVLVMFLLILGLVFSKGHNIPYLDYINQLIYIAGNVLATPGGGIIIQILSPVTTIIYARYKSLDFVFSLGWFWLGVVITNWGVQIEDIRARLLFSVRQNVTDWAAILQAFQLKGFDFVISKILLTLGYVSIGCSLYFAVKAVLDKGRKLGHVNI